MKRALRRFGVDLRDGEGMTAFLLFFSFFLIITFQYTAKSVRQSTFIDVLGAAKLPYVYLGVALLSYPILRLYSLAADRVRRHILIAATCTVIAASMVAFWWAYQFSLTWTPVIFYVWVSIVFVMTVSQFWSFVNHVLDPRQARRLFGLVGAGGLLGGIAGGQVARYATAFVGTRFALLVAAGIILLFVGLIFVVQRLSPVQVETERPRTRAGGTVAPPPGGLAAILQSRMLTLIAIILTLTVMVAQIVDLQFNWAVEAGTSGLDERTAFFGNFYSVMGISAFIFQLIFTARIHRALGAGFAMRVLPTTMAIGTIALFIASGMFPAALVLAAVVLKVGENGLRYSLDQATRELLFLPVPSDLRIKAKAFIDVFVQRGAKGLAALVLLPVTLGLITAVQSGWISLVLIVVWLGVTAVAYREYVRAFREGLERRTIDDTLPINLSDATTLRGLVQSLGSADPRRVLHGMQLLANNGSGDLVPPTLLYHDAPEVRLEVLRILAANERSDAVETIERRLGDEDPAVRAEAARVLAGFRCESLATVMVPRLQDPDPGVRAAAVACLLRDPDRTIVERAEGTMAQMMVDAAPAVRAEVAKALGELPDPDHQWRLMSLLSDADPSVIEAAVLAIRRRIDRAGFTPIYTPALISLLQDRRVKKVVRESLVACGEPAIPAMVHFLNDPGEAIQVRRELPGTIARIATPAAVDALERCLGTARDLRLRRNLIDALGSFHGEEARFEKSRDIAGAIRTEATSYLASLSDLNALGSTTEPGGDAVAAVRKISDGDPSLLEQLLVDRLGRSFENLFGLLALRGSSKDVWAAHRSLMSGARTSRTYALEFLDNTLSGDVKQHVFAVIDDVPLVDRLQAARKHYGIEQRTKAETLRAIAAVDSQHGEDAESLTAAALYSIYLERIESLYDLVQELLSEPRRSFVGETARWVASRLNIEPASGSGGMA